MIARWNNIMIIFSAIAYNARSKYIMLTNKWQWFFFSPYIRNHLVFEVLSSLCMLPNTLDYQSRILIKRVSVDWIFFNIYIFIYFNHEFEFFFTLTFQAPNNPTIAISRAIVIWCLMAYLGGTFTEELLKEYREVKQVDVKIEKA